MSLPAKRQRVGADLASVYVHVHNQTLFQLRFRSPDVEATSGTASARLALALVFCRAACGVLMTTGCDPTHCLPSWLARALCRNVLCILSSLSL